MGLRAFCTATLPVGAMWLHLPLPALRSLAFLALVFGSQTSIYAIRKRGRFWHSVPSLWVMGSTIAAILIVSGMATTGLAMASLPILRVFAVLRAAIAFAAIVEVAKIPIFHAVGMS
ncbi:hypothetical protein [Acidiphilium acidophilum]|uniref:hypothetical protein n=1 Tax=Acidiphilium acidophilum TaxID=76588 RepID=UPI002E8E6B93|nr:hypothetical protein [Acidiphilium acidophilum]